MPRAKYIRIDLLDMPIGAHPMDTPDAWMEAFKRQLERTLDNQGTSALVTIVQEPASGWRKRQIGAQA